MPAAWPQRHGRRHEVAIHLDSLRRQHFRQDLLHHGDMGRRTAAAVEVDADMLHERTVVEHFRGDEAGTGKGAERGNSSCSRISRMAAGAWWMGVMPWVLNAEITSLGASALALKSSVQSVFVLPLSAMSFNISVNGFCSDDDSEVWRKCTKIISIPHHLLAIISFFFVPLQAETK